MSEPISAGDLVQVVYVCCNGHGANALGTIHMVSGFRTYDGVCSECRKPFGPAWVHFDNAAPNLLGVPLLWLKRIPPLGELDDVKRNEEITA